MAEYEERSLDDLTEEPTQHRLEELRSRGQVVQSRELTSTIALIGVFCSLYFLAHSFILNFSELLKEILSQDLYKALQVQDWSWAFQVCNKCIKFMIISFFPIAITGLCLGILASLAQTGFLITTESLLPDFNRVNPISNFLRLFSVRTITESFKVILKFSIIVLVAYFVLKSEFFFFPNIVGLNVNQIIEYLATTAARVLGLLGVFLLGVSGLDYFIQWRAFRRHAMMTRSEARQDLKEREGDPQIKARVRSIQREVARKRMMKAVPKADVIVTNPTHIAVALAYNPKEAAAPKVLAKGADFLAERIKKVAREHGIPTVENKPLARSLYRTVKVGQLIPRSLYQAVAEILAYVYKIKGKKFRAGAQ